MPAWVIHDLRRTARSLMSRAGVRPDIAERVLGHAIRGVEGVYDRHSYEDEKGEALNQLAALVERIINPPSSENIVNMRPRRRERAR
jgi:integrase